jgi:replicative DNA helicase Mcm
MPIDDITVKSLLRDFFIKYEYNLMIVNIANKYPDERSLYIDFTHIRKFSDELEKLVQKDPERIITLAEIVAKEIANNENISKINIRFKNIPDEFFKKIREIRSKNIGKLISVDGTVNKVKEVGTKLVMASFMCTNCGAVIKKDQDSDILEYPAYCPQCKAKKGETKFKILEKESVYIDTQKIEIKENSENIEYDEQPSKIIVYLEDDLTGLTKQGDRVKVTGILKAKQRGIKTQKTLGDLYIYAISIELPDKIESQNVRTSYELILDIIKQINNNRGVAEENEIIKVAEAKGIDEKTVRKIIETLKRDNLIFEVFSGKYKYID